MFGTLTAFHFHFHQHIRKTHLSCAERNHFCSMNFSLAIAFDRLEGVYKPNEVVSGEATCWLLMLNKRELLLLCRKSRTGSFRGVQGQRLFYQVWK